MESIWQYFQCQLGGLHARENGPVRTELATWPGTQARTRAASTFRKAFIPNFPENSLDSAVAGVKSRPPGFLHGPLHWLIIGIFPIYEPFQTVSKFRSPRFRRETKKGLPAATR